MSDGSGGCFGASEPDSQSQDVGVLMAPVLEGLHSESIFAVGAYGLRLWRLGSTASFISLLGLSFVNVVFSRAQPRYKQPTPSHRLMQVVAAFGCRDLSVLETPIEPLATESSSTPYGASAH